MKKNTVLSIISILVCFLIGYAVFQATNLIGGWVMERLSECKSVDDSPCVDGTRDPHLHHARPQNLNPL